MRLMKNRYVRNHTRTLVRSKEVNELAFFREAARECRRKKKEYIKCLENRVAVLENQNKALIEELKKLKELYSGNGAKSVQLLLTLTVHGGMKL